MSRKRPPAEKRAIAQAVHELLDTHNKMDAYTVVGERFEMSTFYVSKLYADALKTGQLSQTPPQAAYAVSAPNPLIYAPFVHTNRANTSVELSRDVTSLVFISDIHWHPEHSMGEDPAAYAAAIEMMRAINPDIIFFGGDILDCYAPSRYEKIPRLSTPEAYDGEIHYGRERLAEMRVWFPNTRMLWLTGNHELRLPKNVRSNAPWLYNRIADVETELNIGQFDIQGVEPGHKIGKLSFFHGHDIMGGGVNPAKSKWMRMLINFICGHIHRFSRFEQVSADGELHGGFTNGTLQWFDVDYVPGMPLWSRGITVVNFARSGMFQVDQIPIHKPSILSPRAECLYQGKHVKVNMESGNAN